MIARCFSSQQVRALSDTLLFLYESDVEADPIERMIEAIGRLVPATWFSVDELFPGTDNIEHRGGRNLENIPDLSEGVSEFAYQNPSAEYLLHRGFAPALRMSALATFRAVSRTGFYVEVLKHLTGFRDQLGVISRLPKSCLAFTLNRDRPFSEEERLLLEVLQPHLERILNRSTQYADLPANPPLTPREREVLHWLCEGKRDSEIAVILQIKARTAEQHVRSILRKFSTESRAAVITTVWRSRAFPTAPRDA